MSEKWGQRANHCLQTLEGQVNTETYNLPGQKPIIRNLPGNSCQGKKTWTVTELLEAPQVWQLKTPGLPVTGNPSHCCVLPPGALSDFHSEYRRKIPLVSGKEEENKPFWNMPEHCVLLNKVWPEEKLFYQNLTWEDLSGPNLSVGRKIPNFSSLLGCHMREVKYIIPAPSSHPVAPNGKKLRNTGDFHSQGTLRPNHRL